MTRFNLETELTNALNELTPEERALLSKATAADWASAAAELVTDPGFWGEMGTAFLRGLERGLTR